MLPFIGSITSNCCSILTQREKFQEDLEGGGILTIVGLTMPNKRQMSKAPNDNDHLRSFVVDDCDDDDDDGINNIDSNITQSTDDNIQKILTRSTESLYPFGTGNQQSTTMRRLSHNLNNERRRSLLWIRPTTEEIIARASHRITEESKLYHREQFNSTRGLSVSN
ncbi:hypothetical protein QQG55_54420 [Brugia pahangi]|uniref:Uncharacterized protein n=1 Tax=Brugia pahangi TaxID=6280 RepID=A0A0N4TUE2_BRUPA|nr:unnamed protein product [Brugia pahangi]